MNCKKCGAFLTENDQFCKKCGASANAQSVETLNNSTNNNIMTSNQASGFMSNNNMNGNVVNNGQPSMNNGYYSQPNNYNNKSSNAKYIVLGTVIAIALFAVIVVLSVVFDNSGKSNQSGGGNNSDTAETANSTYKVNFKGFTLSIPDNLVYEQQANSLMIGNEAGTWVTVLELEKGSFAKLKENKSQLQSIMQQGGYTASIASEKTLKGVDFITLEITRSGEKAIAALAKANSMYFFGVTAYNQNNEYDYSLLEKVAPILSTAKYNDATNNIQSSTKIDMNGVAGLAK